MDILESVKMATTTLLANKLRSSLTMLGIIIGNASVTLVLQDAKAIAKQVRAVKEVAPEINNRITINYRNRNTSSTVIGTTANYATLRSLEIKDGRFFNEFDVKRNKRIAVVGPDLAAKLFDNQNPVGQKIRIQNTTFQIIGLTVAKGSSFGSNNDDTVYIPINTMFSRLVGRTSPFGINISLISVSAKDENSISAAEFNAGFCH